MPSLELERVEPLLESFARARSVRAWRHLAGERRGLGLELLYDDFPNLRSRDLLADLREAPADDERRQRDALRLFVSAYLENETAVAAERAARFETESRVVLGDAEVPWRSLPPRWERTASVAARHELHQAWRDRLREDAVPQLRRWAEEMAQRLARLGWAEPYAAWAQLRGMEADGVRTLAQRVLDLSAETYASALRGYLNLLNLPVGDAWTADADGAFRAEQFDLRFPHKSLMPAVVRTFRGLGIEIEDQLALRFDWEERPTRVPGAAVVATHVPNETWVSVRPNGGYRDLERLLGATAQAQQPVHTDATLPFYQRWLGDDTTALGYGMLFASLVRNPTWQQEFVASPPGHDFHVVAHLAWTYRVRQWAALALAEQMAWADPSGSPWEDVAEQVSLATHVRHFAEEGAITLLAGQPWRVLRPALLLRAAVFSAQVQRFLRQEFDDEWWRSRRAGKFLVQELWRPGRRHSAEQVLRLIGQPGLDPAILWSESAEVLATV